MMTPSEFRDAASHLGLVAILCESRAESDAGKGGARGTPFWMLSVGGREVGTYVPSVGSARVGKTMHRGLSDAAALAAYAELGKH
jgi:hypothetical protein